MAVDPSSGDVYTTGFFDIAKSAPGSISKFDESGALFSPPSPFGGGLYAGAAVNPTDGDLYVVNVGAQEIETYDRDTGALLSSFAVPSFGEIELTHSALSNALVEIATDAAGDVYVPNAPGKEVLEYSPAGTLLQTFTAAGPHALDGPTGVAVDPFGNVWIADAHDRIVELAPSGALVGEFESEGVQALALGAQGEVFAVVENDADFCGSLQPPCAHLLQYSSTGSELADIGAGSIGGGAGIPVPSMLAINGSNGRIYVTDGSRSLVRIVGPPRVPDVGKQLAAEVGATEAKLGASVDPGGIETSYRFEYDTREYGRGEGPHGVSVPFPEGNVGQGVTPRTVWAAAGGLAPGTTYHYRVIATNSLGIVVGADQTFTTETSVEASCPNEQLRSGFSASLPDCRAYELVTPPNDASAEPEGGGVAAREGDRVSYTATDVLPGAQSAGESYLATRESGGWSSEDVIPLQSYTAECPGLGAAVLAYSADLSEGVLFDGARGRASAHGEEEGETGVGGCDAEGVEVVGGEPLGYKNLLLRNNAAGSYQLINVLPAGVAPADANFEGASAGLNVVVFEEHAQLTADAPAGSDDLYEWSEGALRLVTVLPDGVPVGGALASERQPAHAVSADGSHVFFTAGGHLYVRLSGVRTIELDEPRGGSGPGGGGSFWDASADGSQIFFSDEAAEGLTSDTVSGSGKNLYHYDLDTGELSDLTPAGHAEVEGVVGVSEDGSYAYFVADGALPAGGTQGQPNLYRWQDGKTTFLATLEPGTGILHGDARVSPNGIFLAFASAKSLTGYENNGAAEIFLDNAATNELVCVSCNPSGETAVYGAEPMVERGAGAPHYLSDSGRLFFDTREALLPRDTNSETDVYEYEDGQTHLISAGTSSSESLLLDASESGDDVFFLTRQALVPRDTEEEAQSIYDARTDGGFPEPSEATPCTTADACRAAPIPQPAIFGAPSSQTFSGTGNPTPSSVSKPKTKPKSKPARCKKGLARKKGKCTRRRGRKTTKRLVHAKRRIGK